MPKKGIEKRCPHCGEYGRKVTREAVAGRPGKTFLAASCLKCGRSDRTRAKLVFVAVVKCKGFEQRDGTPFVCLEPLMLAELLSYGGRCSTCAHAHDELKEEEEAAREVPDGLKLWNGRGWDNVEHVFVAASSASDAVRLLQAAGHFFMTRHELNVYFSRCWGGPMKYIQPRRGVWIQRKGARAVERVEIQEGV